MPITATLTPSRGQEFEVPHVIDTSWAYSRSVAQDGSLGQAGFDIDCIELVRHRSLQGENENVQTEEEITNLAAGPGQGAYCSGEVAIYSPNDDANPVKRIAWDRGFICNVRTRVSGNEITESISISVVSLSDGNSKFEREMR